MFENRSFRLYDLFYDALGKDYEWEATQVLKLARRRFPRGRRPHTLVDVACGSGRHLEVFSRSLRCVGVDIEPAFFPIAAARCPEVPFVEADMVVLDLGADARFDIVTCLFSAVAYVGTVARLRRAVRAMARHLTPGGVLLVEPWFEPEEWRDGEVHTLAVDTPAVQATRMSRSGRRRGDTSILDFHYLVGDEAGVEYFVERHELRLFRMADYVDAFERAGLVDVDVDEYGLFGRGLVIGQTPVPAAVG